MQSFDVVVPNRAPVAVGEAADLEVEVDSAAEVDVAGHFEDPSRRRPASGGSRSPGAMCASSQKGGGDESAAANDLGPGVLPRTVGSLSRVLYIL